MNTDIGQSEGLLTPQEAADYLGIRAGTLYYLRRTKQVACYLVGRKLRFRRADLEAYLDKCRVPAVE